MNNQPEKNEIQKPKQPDQRGKIRISHEGFELSGLSSRHVYFAIFIAGAVIVTAFIWLTK